MKLEEILEAVRTRKVEAPIGTKTLIVYTVDPQGRMDMAGMAEPGHALAIAYNLLKQVMEPGAGKPATPAENGAGEGAEK